MAKKRKHKAFSALAVAATTLVVVAPVVASANFSDVKETDSYYEGVQYLTQLGAIKGYADGTFKPLETISREHAAKILAETLQLDLTKVGDSPFTDVPATSPYAKHITALYELDILSGYSDKTFKPKQNITRAQMAKIIVKAYELEASTAAHPFTDVNKDGEFNSYIATLFANDITNGTTATTFSPLQPVKRGQFASFVYRANTLEPVKPEGTISFLHVNDTHANIENAPKRVTIVKEERAKNPDAILVDAGDAFSGTLYFNEFKGKVDVELMNLMKVDVMTFGNHEFDLGSSAEGHKALADFIKAAQFPFVTANIDFSADPLFTGLFNTKIVSGADIKAGNIYTGIVKEINGEKVGFFGLTTAETATISSPASVKFKNYIEEAQKVVDEFEAMGVNKVVAVTHIGYDDNPAVDNDQELAKYVDGIDVIIGGHTHTQLNEPVVVKNTKTNNPTIIVQAYQYGDFVGKLDVVFDENGIVTSHNGELLATKDAAEDEAAKALIKPYTEKITQIKEEEIGVTLAQALTNPRANETSSESVRANETILGNIITDGMLAKAKDFDQETTMAFQNGGGIRAAINEGPITVGEVITVLPFGNTLAIMKVTGAEIKAAFEHSLKEFPKESGGFLHVSGAKVQFDASKPVGERVVSIAEKQADGTYKELVDTATYTVATNAFTAKGGDDFAMFGKAYAEGRVTDLGLSDWENLRNQLLTIKDAIPTTIEGRIVDVSANRQAGLTYTFSPYSGGASSTVDFEGQ